jgi:hypothetical protein
MSNRPQELARPSAWKRFLLWLDGKQSDTKTSKDAEIEIKLSSTQQAELRDAIETADPTDTSYFRADTTSFRRKSEGKKSDESLIL